jgi:hypothetical protein
MVVARRIRRAIVTSSSLALVFAGACAFDASGNSRGLGVLEPADEDALDDDDDGDDDDGDDGAEPEPEPGEDGATRPDDGGSVDDDDGGNEAGTDDGDEGSVLETGAQDDGGTTDDGGDVDGGTSDDGANEDGTDDGAQDMCPIDVLELHWAASASIADPMELLQTEGAMSDPEVAVSGVAEEGTATFPLEFECGGEYYVWGLVWDYYPGAYGTDDPDSYYVGVGGPEPTWRYGCQTGDVGSGLSWQKLESLTNQPCDVEPIVIDVVAGTELELTFRNREAGWSSEVAGIAAIVISNDPDADPYSLYDPY